MLPTRDPPQNKGPTLTESGGLKKLFQANKKEKISWGTNTHSRQNRFQNKGHSKRHRRTFQNNQGKNPS